ncbi:hypothetical protein SBF1_2350005 [Candidatus Desulfosporosinus infrequens]|uniref:Uncharacterized protein n=1 Tax=Candidatus Desulfosporosinus infrequens TaxID=2043169 RepID=A0A2U3KMD3_9FIRM|nr:hypothetical protein SBF1_2350005 [Candidatus Desulfosporosinus infrequens]
MSKFSLIFHIILTCICKDTLIKHVKLLLISLLVTVQSQEVNDKAEICSRVVGLSEGI